MLKKVRYIDLFCGIGGFRVAAENVLNNLGVDGECVFSSDIDEHAQNAYEANFGERPEGDISEVHEDDIPDHDVLLAGFPCQPFSICGDMKGFEDARGTLFFEIARILNRKKPAAFILENVKLLRSHDKGRTLQRILETLNELGYYASYRVLNALDFGVPQKRERIFIVGFRQPLTFSWPQGGVPMKPLSEILEAEVDNYYYASDHIRERRVNSVRGKPIPKEPTIWHENKGGNIGIHKFSCAMRAGASYNYLLVNGERRLTEREMLRLQGFPDHYKVVCKYSESRKQAGNSVAVPVVERVFHELYKALTKEKAVIVDGRSQPVQQEMYV